MAMGFNGRDSGRPLYRPAVLQDIIMSMQPVMRKKVSEIREKIYVQSLFIILF